jgi:hypothetical protein
VGIRAQCEAAARVSQETREPFAHPVGPGHRMLPLVVHVAGRVQPGRHLSVEAAVRPRLVGVAGEQQALGYGESGIVGREGVGGGVNGGGIHVIEECEV